MPARKYISWSSVLMIGSLCLLAAFQYVWLQSEYQDAYDQLNDQQTRRLHTAIRELEDSLFQIKVWTPLSFNKDSIDCENPKIRIRTSETPDTGHLFTVMRSVEVASTDSIRIRRHRARHANMMLGTLSAQIQTDGDSLQVVFAVPDMINTKLRNSMTLDDPQFNLIAWDSAPPDTASFLSKSYFDVFSGQHYALSYPGYRQHLLRAIFPQFLFAVLLFACIAGAFWLISRNLVRQQRLAEIRSNLISNITHELKTPIATVHVALEALQSFDAAQDKGRREEYLDIAQNEMQRLALLVENVLKNSNAGHTHAQMKVEQFDIKALLTHVLDTLKVQFGRQAATVRMHATGEDFTIEADRLQVTGLIHNLLDNALKYGGPRPEIDVSIAQQNGNYTLLVKDQGMGIPDEFRKRIFEKFFRVPSGDTHNIKGYGLGLSYVAEVVKEHRGSIDVSSNPGQGTTFKVLLPRTHAN